MTPEKMMEIMQKSEVEEVMQAIMLKNSEEQKRNRVKNYKLLNEYVKKGQILFVGSSLMEWFPISEMQLTLDINYVIYNRGIAGFTTTELLAAMDECIFDLEPSKIFINIGTNDISSIGTPYKLENLLANYNEIMDQIQKTLPECKVYVMAYYPINEKVYLGEDNIQRNIISKSRTRTNAAIMEANEAIEELAKKHGFNYINVNDGLTDEEGNLKEEYSVDGIHIWPNAYSIIFENVKKYLDHIIIT